MTSRTSPVRSNQGTGAGSSPRHWLSRPWVLMVALLAGALLVLFHQSFAPRQVLFANDVTLGQMEAPPNHLPGAFFGIWYPGAWIGMEGASIAPTISAVLKMIFAPNIFLKFYGPLTLFFIGFSTWLLFRQLQFCAMACVLGGLAAALNGHFFSVACWGEGNWNISVGCAFLAMAAVSSKTIPKAWERGVLAGLAIGICVMEGFDVGAILAIFVGIFILFHALSQNEPLPARLANAFILEIVVVGFAGLVAAHTALNLVHTQVEGISLLNQETESKEKRWNSATQWSLPKTETLSVVAPGLFGYRMAGNIQDVDHSSEYWGSIGQDARLPLLGSDDPRVRQFGLSQVTSSENLVKGLDTPDRHSRTPGLRAIAKEDGLFWRYRGTGECAGVMVCLVALFGFANVFRSDSSYSKPESRAVGFWSVVALFSLVASWGRFAFLYGILYHLPYISTIRNPIKFMNPFHIAVIILAGYGLEALHRRYLRGPARNAEFLPLHLKHWWSRVAGFDRRWAWFMLAIAIAAVAGYFVYSNEKAALIQYLQDQAIEPTRALGVANFSISSALWFVVFLVASVLVLCAVISGVWTGPGARWAGIAVGCIILFDLGRSDIPWIRYFDYGEKYSPDPLISFLSDKPYEHRYTARIEPTGPGSGVSSRFGQLCYYWLQNDFPIDAIQTLDFAQMPRMQDLDRNYFKTFQLTNLDINTVDLRPAFRLWQLTNTRYYGGPAGLVAKFFDRFDTNHEDFRVISRFNLGMKYGVGHLSDGGDMVTEPVNGTGAGQYDLIEYVNALPRAKLFANWRTPASDDETLKTLVSPDFRPQQTVLVARNSDLPQADSSGPADAGEVTITSYHPKDVQLDASAKTGAILLLNDHINPNWHVKVDGKSTRMLRCNYIMRGVYLTAGHHTVEFQYRPPLGTLYVSLGAIAGGILLAGYLAVGRRPIAAAPVPLPVPAAPAAEAPKQPSTSAKTGVAAPVPKRKKQKVR